MSKIQDFVYQSRANGALLQYPKGTNVLFRLPKRLVANNIEFDFGTVLAHTDDSYAISYGDEELEVKRLDVICQSSDLQNVPVTDSKVFIEVNPKNADEVAAAAIALDPSANSESVKDLVEELSGLSENKVSLSLSSTPTGRFIKNNSYYYIY